MPSEQPKAFKAQQRACVAHPVDSYVPIHARLHANLLGIGNTPFGTRVNKGQWKVAHMHISELETEDD